MTVKRIVVDVASPDVAGTKAFYTALFGLHTVMDQGWIVTLAGDQPGAPQISIGSEGGSGAPMPDMSIEVDDVDAIHTRAKAMGCTISYALTDEPWGVRRFFVKDPAGKTVNVLQHKG